MSEFFDPSSYLNGEIARGERALEDARSASVVAAPDGYDSGEIVPIIERYLEELRRLRDAKREQNADRT
jgi:hypothetical protein